MSDQDHERLRRVFDRAIDLPARERPAFLARECAGDEALRARIEAVLAAAEDERFLAGTRGAGAGHVELPAEGPGTRIGPYRLLQPIGEGGFGAVFLAEQEHPVRRRVALKVVKLGMDTRQVVARFEQERQALALMDHPNIARVYDAGATATGRPYFVMELVRGEPIAQYCDRHELSIDERLGLFAQVCDAVQHAHSKGIIHRDLKPSNVLVGTQDGRPLAKVIDFGIAKATSKLTDKTLFTEHLQVIGTLAYMSPEQAEGSLDIDTRADVYALGVLLYELLTGSTPFDADTLRVALYSEVQRLIREVEPPRPSTRIVQSAETLASLAARRRVEPRRLGTLVRGELDWIVMKALEKERARRYESAHGLAADVRRYLGGEAVHAAPPSAAYRLRKLVRRNRGLVLAGTAVAAALLAGAVGFAWQASVAREERDRALAAQQAEAGQRRVADEQRALAEARHLEAERLRTEAEGNAAAEARARKRAETTAEFVTDALKSSDPNSGGEQGITVDRAMQQAVALLDAGAFRDEPDLEGHLRKLIADILHRNGRVAESLPLAERALAIFTELAPSGSADLAVSLNQVATIRQDLGRLAEAEPLFLRALDLQRGLHPGDHEAVSLALNNLALVRARRGRPAEAEPLLAESLEIKQRLLRGDHADVAMGLNNLAAICEQLGRRPEAVELYERALAMYERLYDAHPQLAMALYNLGQLRIPAGRLAEARELLDRALAMYRALFRGDHPDTARALSGAANARRALGRLAEAEALTLEALEMERRLFPGDHPAVALELASLAGVRQELGDLEGARQAAGEALEMRRRLFPDGHPDLARSLDSCASIDRDLGRPAQAEPLLAEALEVQRGLHPGDHVDVARAQNRLAATVAELGRAGEGERLSRQALAMLERVLPGDQPVVASARASLGLLLLDAGRPADAEAELREAVAMARRAYGGDHYDVAVGLTHHARALQALGRGDEAAAAFEESIAIHRRRTPEGSPMMVVALWRAGAARLAGGDPDGARPLLAEAVALGERMYARGSRQLEKYRASLAACEGARTR